ncbi:MAG: chemotaxis protein CheW [Pseudomonadota bacterium]
MSDTINASQEFVTLRLAGQLLGIPVLQVHDVLKAQNMTPVPIAPSWVAGLINLRGRIVTCIDLRARLGLPPATDEDEVTGMSVVVEQNGEPYSLLIDRVGDVLKLPIDDYERNPVTLEASWAEVSAGVYRLDGELLVILDVEQLLDFVSVAEAA